MTEEPGPRKLAAIMSIDMVGYSALSEVDEAEAAARVARLRAALEGAALVHGGRIFNTAGDGFMLEFCSAAGALGAAELLWVGVDRHTVRVGVHVGDVLAVENGDLLGHSVNVAARLQELAEPGSVLVSMDVRRAVRGKLANRLHPAGDAHLDGMVERIEIFTLEAVEAPKPRPRKAEPVLAVLPFENESDDPEMGFIAEGVAEEIIYTLLRQSSVKVIGRTSAFQFHGDRKAEAAAALGATHVLDGAVRCAGERLRVMVHLSDAAGMALWNERFEGDRSDPFALEDEIAAKVAASLHRQLTQADRSAPLDAAAHELYLRARQMWLMMSDVEEDHAAELLERCVRKAPEFAPAWAMLASVRALLLPRDRDALGSPEHDAALAAAQRALEIDPDCAQAFAALSLLKPAFADHGEKLRLINEALKRMPNDASLHVARAAWLYAVGRLKDAAKALETASLLDPLGPAVEGLRGSLLSARGDVATALDVVGGAWARWPDSAFIWYLMWSTLCVAKRVDEAEAMAAHGVAPKRAVSAYDLGVLQRYAAMLRLEEAERRQVCMKALDEMAASSEPLSISSACFAAGFGCADRAFDVIDAALDSGRGLKPDNHVAFGMARSQSPLQFFVATGGEPIWRHPRFAKLAARLGLAQYWIETKKWPDCASLVEYDFKAACADAVKAL
ncbi:MAG: adenylate/guanylate cyclase domain-containing protein [Hyphomonadaceae bacterium]